MGTAIDLLKKSQQAFVQNQNLSVSESVAYTHKETQITIPELKAFIGRANFVEKKGKRLLGDFIVLANVILESSPEVDDKIVYEGRTYKVEHWFFQTGMYTVYAQHNKRHVGRR